MKDGNSQNQNDSEQYSMKAAALAMANNAAVMTKILHALTGQNTISRELLDKHRAEQLEKIIKKAISTGPEPIATKIIIEQMNYSPSSKSENNIFKILKTKDDNTSKAIMGILLQSFTMTDGVINGLRKDGVIPAIEVECKN